MARFSRLDTVLITLRTGLIPVVPTADAATTIGIVDALADGGVRVVELTNRGDGAVEVFAAVEAHCRDRRPDVIVGIGSVFDAGTASQYLNLGASFVVSPFLVDDVAVTCNRRMTAYMPGAATPGEVIAPRCSAPRSSRSSRPARSGPASSPTCSPPARGRD